MARVGLRAAGSAARGGDAGALGAVAASPDEEEVLRHGVRSLAFVKREDRALASASESPADVLVLDLEDAVAAADKAAAREQYARHLGDGSFRGKHVFVRVNAPSESPGWTRADVLATADAAVAGFLVPMAQSAADMEEMDRLCALAEARAGLPMGHFRLVPVVESPGAVLRAPEICGASQRIWAAIVGTADLRAATGAHETAASNLVPRTLTVLACRAAGILPIDTACTMIDNAAFESECRHARELGFAGKVTLTPAQTVIANRAFAPTRAESEWAHKVDSIQGAGGIVRAHTGASREFVGPPHSGAPTPPRRFASLLSLRPHLHHSAGAARAPALWCPEMARRIRAREAVLGPRSAPRRLVRDAGAAEEEEKTRQLAGPGGHAEAATTTPEVVPRGRLRSRSVPPPSPGAHVAPAMLRFGARPDMKPGDIVDSPLELTLSEGMASAWMHAFYARSRANTSAEFASALYGTATPLPPFSLLASLALAMTVSKLSEHAILHLGAYHALLLRPPQLGETVRCRYRVDALRATHSGGNVVAETTHELWSATAGPLLQLQKRTLFRAGSFDGEHVAPAASPGSAGSAGAEGGAGKDGEEEAEGCPDRTSSLAPAPHPYPSSSSSSSSVSGSGGAGNAGRGMPAAASGEGHVFELPMHALVRDRVDVEMAHWDEPPVLERGAVLAHRLVHVLTRPTTLNLCNLLRVTNAHHLDDQTYAHHDLLVPGPVSVAASLANVEAEIGDVVAEYWLNATNVTRVNQGDLIASLSFIHDVRPVPGNSLLEEVVVQTFGVRNTPPGDLTDIRVPRELFSLRPHRPRHYERICADKCPVLYNNIACQVTRSVVRVKSK